MTKRTRTLLAGSALLCGLAVAMPASADDDAAAELAALRSQNAALRARVAEVNQQEQETWMSERRKEEVRLLVKQVLADADTRSSLLQDGATAGHDGKFFLASPDGSFRLNIGGQTQFRYIANFRDEASASGDSDTTTGFQHRRTRLKFDGHIGNPRIGYEIVLAASRNSGDIGIEDALVSYAITDRLTLAGGTMKLPLLREELTSSSRQLAVERSLVNATFTGSRSTGVRLTYDTDAIRYAAMFSQGAGRGYTDFDSPGNADFALTGRADIKLAGNWRQHRDFSAWDGEAFAAFLGAAAHYEVGEGGTTAVNRDFLTWTVDGSVEVDNLGLFAAVIGNHDTKVGSGEEKFTDFGLVAQAGYMINNNLEPFVRYEMLLPDSDRDVDDISLITAGVNYYLAGHNAKFTADVVYALDSLDPVMGFRGGSDGLGLLSDAPGSDGQFAIRAQFQLLF